MHAGMLTARKHCNAHNAYAKFRSAMELLETFGLASLPPVRVRENDASGPVSRYASLNLETGRKRVPTAPRESCMDIASLEDVDMAHREFVQSIEDGYQDFLALYREAVGISRPSEGVNESKKRDGIYGIIANLKSVQSSRVTATSLKELQRELVRLQEARQQDKIEYQRKLADQKQQLDLADQKQRQLERQLELLDKKFQQHLEQMRGNC